MSIDLSGIETDLEAIAVKAVAMIPGVPAFLVPFAQKLVAVAIPFIFTEIEKLFFKPGTVTTTSTTVSVTGTATTP